MRILIIEDDKIFAHTLRDVLSSQFTVDTEYSGEGGCLLATSNDYDLCLIDLYLPDMDGREVCRIIKGVNQQLPIIFITGETKTALKVSSLDSGADDYITKPIKTPELLARIRAVIRGKTENSSAIGILYTYKGVSMNLKSHTCTAKGKILHLSKKEFDILLVLIRSNNKIVSRDRLISATWQRGEDIQSNILDVYISRLRKKIPRCVKIEPIYSKGYMIK